MEDKSAGPSTRKRRLVLDGDMEIKIKDLYERYVLFDMLKEITQIILISVVHVLVHV